MKIMYFAWVRERTGLAEEDVTPPGNVTTIGDLIGWLSSRGPEYEMAFENADFIRAAMDHEHVEHDASILGAREVAFFPPMTGG